MSITNLNKTDAATTLVASPQLRRLTENLHDLIIIALEHYTKTRGNYYALTKLEYVSGEKQDEKSYMRFDVLVKDLHLNVNTPLQVTIGVNTEEPECYRH